MSSWRGPPAALYFGPHCARPTPWPNPLPSSTTTGVPVWARAGSITAHSAASVKKRTKTPLRTVLIRSEAATAAHGPPGSFFDHPRRVSCLVSDRRVLTGVLSAPPRWRLAGARGDPDGLVTWPVAERTDHDPSGPDLRVQ